MAFAQLVEREAVIRQSQLLPRIFPDEIEVQDEEPPCPMLALPDDDLIIPTINTTSTSNYIIYNTIRNEIITSGTDFNLYEYGNYQRTATSNNITEGSIYLRTIGYNNIYRTDITSSRTVSSVIFETSAMQTTGGTGTVITNGVYRTANGQWTAVVPSTASFRGVPRTSVDVQKSTKNSIKRALKLLENHGMEADTKIFLHGKDVEVSHPDSPFKFVITRKKYGSIILLTEQPGYSTPFRLALFMKDGRFICDLCVYAEDTPMLDQLLMVTMFVKSGNEEDLLRQANFIGSVRDKELREQLVLTHDFMEKKLH